MKNKNSIILYILYIFFFLIISTHNYLIYIGLMFINFYNMYFPTFKEIDFDTLKYMSEDKFRVKSKLYLVSDKISGLDEFIKKMKSEDILKNTNSFTVMKFKLREYIFNNVNFDNINKVNLDIPSTQIAGYDYTIDSSPIVKITMDNVFAGAIASTKPTINIVNSNFSDSPVVGTHILYGNNRNYRIIDNILFGPKSPGRELLNYESNVLYCLINGLASPGLPLPNKG